MHADACGPRSQFVAYAFKPTDFVGTNLLRYDDVNSHASARAAPADGIAHSDPNEWASEFDKAVLSMLFYRRSVVAVLQDLAARMLEEGALILEYRHTGVYDEPVHCRSFARLAEFMRRPGVSASLHHAVVCDAVSCARAQRTHGLPITYHSA